MPYNAKIDKPKGYSFFIELYPDDTTINCEDVLTSLVNDSISYAYILHDMDANEDGVLKKPHYHIYVKFPRQYSRKRISELYGIQPNLVEYSITEKMCIRYLMHVDNPEKYQYTLNAVNTNIDIEKYINDHSVKLNYLNIIVEYIIENNPKTFRDVVMWAKSQDKELLYILSRNAYFIKNMI